MKRPVALAAVAIAATLGLAGCGGTDTQTGETVDQPAQEQVALDFDGNGLSDTGSGTMTLATAGGSTEGGNVPEIANPGANALISIEIDYEGGDGSVCDVYVDGMSIDTQINADEYLGQYSIALSGDALAPGEHTVEVVSMDGDSVSIYKTATYSVSE